MRTIRFEATEFETAREAIEYAGATACGVAILLDGRHYVVAEETADRLQNAGVEFAFVAYAERLGRIVTIPVN